MKSRERTEVRELIKRYRHDLDGIEAVIASVGVLLERLEERRPLSESELIGLRTGYREAQRAGRCYAAARAYLDALESRFGWVM